MPLSSPSFPAGGYAQHAPNIQATGPWSGRFNDDTGQVTVHGSATLTKGVGHLAWEGLAYLETILAETRSQRAVVERLSAGVDSLTTTLDRQSLMLEGLAGELATLREQQALILEALGFARVPAWQTVEEVERGDDMGLERPPAHRLDLVVEYWAMNGDAAAHLGNAFVPSLAMPVLSTTPPVGSLVRRGTTIQVLIDIDS